MSFTGAWGKIERMGGVNFLASLAKRFRITIRELMYLTAAIAAVTALLISNANVPPSGFVMQLDERADVE